jgi:hypothetical protein
MYYNTNSIIVKTARKYSSVKMFPVVVYASLKGVRTRNVDSSLKVYRLIERAFDMRSKIKFFTQ